MSKAPSSLEVIPISRQKQSDGMSRFNLSQVGEQEAAGKYRQTLVKEQTSALNFTLKLLLDFDRMVEKKVKEKLRDPDLTDEQRALIPLCYGLTEK